MTTYFFNKQTLKYEQVPIKRKRRPVLITAAISSLLSLLIGFIIGSSSSPKYYTNANGDHILATRHVIGTNAWLDSTLSKYQKDADLYLARPEFSGTPLSGEMLALAAANAYDSTGILLPVELALAQAQWESGMGLKGKSPHRNPYNIGEYDSGTVLWFESTFDGVQAYYYFMCTDYLKCSSLEELFASFTNCAGYRYASGPYEQHIPQQYYYIKKWLNNHRK